MGRTQLVVVVWVAPAPDPLLYDLLYLQPHHFAAAHTDDYIATIGTNYGHTRAYCEGNRTYFGGDMMCCLRAILYTAATAYTTTTLLRPISTIIWHQWAPIKGTLALNAKAIGPILVEIYFVMSATLGQPFTAPAEPTPPPFGCGP
jgi:hypothetical protein